MRVFIAGGTGFIGGALSAAFADGGHQVTAVGRGISISEPYDIIVNLAGASIAQRWTKRARAEILESRVRTTTLIANAAAQLKPRVLINASAAGFYGDTGDTIADETTPSGDGFLAEVCRSWEAATKPAEDAGVRVVHLRTAVVLGRGGGALAKMLLPFKLGLGGRIGSGRQWMSWIARADVVRAIMFLADNESARGPFNLVAASVPNAEFAATLGHVLHRPAVLPVPAVALRAMFGRMADEALLWSQRVEARRLKELRFQFGVPTLEEALRAAVR